MGLNFADIASLAQRAMQVSDKLAAGGEEEHHAEAERLIAEHGEKFFSLPSGWQTVLRAIARFILAQSDK